MKTKTPNRKKTPRRVTGHVAEDRGVPRSSEGRALILDRQPTAVERRIAKLEEECLGGWSALVCAERQEGWSAYLALKNGRRRWEKLRRRREALLSIHWGFSHRMNFPGEGVILLGAGEGVAA